MTDDSASCTPLRLADGAATAQAVGGEPAAIAQPVVVIRWGKPGTFRLPINKKFLLINHIRPFDKTIVAVPDSQFGFPALRIQKKKKKHFLPIAFNFY